MPEISHKKIKKNIGSLAFFIFILFPFVSHAQELIQDSQEIVKAEVVSIIDQETSVVPGTDRPTMIQTLQVKVLEGNQKGEEITLHNDYLQLEKGEKFYLMHTVDGMTGTDLYSVFEHYRLPWLYFFIFLFVLAALIFGGMQGFRGLLALALSLFFIIYLLLPGILHGFSPILVSVGVSSLIIILGSYITHGFNKTTTSAVIGMIATIGVTSIIAFAAVHLTKLSGFESEESVYLHFNMAGSIDMVGILLGGILIGLLGVLYDAGISQAIAVEELHKVAPHLPRQDIYKRAIRMGREHIGALVDTLAIAYVGASLPLLLLFYNASGGFSMTINRELFAAEIIRAVVGSIGLILAVPITTYLSVLLLIKENKGTEEEIKEEKEKILHVGHTH